jgi:hypothetical protein
MMTAKHCTVIIFCSIHLCEEEFPVIHFVGQPRLKLNMFNLKANVFRAVAVEQLGVYCIGARCRTLIIVIA